MNESRQAGFTLIEMIAVMVLVGALLVFSPMGIQFLVPEKELEAEVSRLAATVAMLHSEAILQQAEFAIHYDTDDNQWSVQIPEEIERANPDPDGEPLKALVLDKDPDYDDFDWHVLPEGITFDLYEGSRRIRSGTFMVTFSPRGTVPPHTLVLESNKIASLNEDDRTRTLKVNFPGFVSYASGRVIDDFKKTEAELGR